MLATLEAIRGHVQAIARTLDPASRYITELLEIVDECTSAREFEERLDRGCRGKRHAGAEAFARMSFEDKIRCNLVTAETKLFRFAEGELEESLAVVQLVLKTSASLRALVVPCSHGEEAYALAAFLLGEQVPFEICAFDIQEALIDEARSGRLTFGFPSDHLAAPGLVGPRVLEKIQFDRGDAFDLPLEADATFDLVLCRNFVGYFVPEVAATLVRKLAARVSSRGRLFLDQFCLEKISNLESELLTTGLIRVGKHPVFGRRP